MEAILSGVSSFLGRHTARAFLQSGHQVTGIVRPKSKNLAGLEELQDMGLRLLRLDFDALPGNTHLQGNAQAIRQTAPQRVFIHFSWDGIGSAGRSDPRIQERNFENACKAYRMAEALGCGKFLFAGSQAEYGRGSRDCPQPVSEYGKAKLRFGEWGLAAQSSPTPRLSGADENPRAESLQRFGIEEHTFSPLFPSKPQFLHLRIFSVYGKGDHESSLIHTLLASLLAGRPISLGPCTQLWNYMEARDCANAVLFLSECPAATTGIYDVAGDETKPLREYVEEMAGITQAFLDSLPGKAKNPEKAECAENTGNAGKDLSTLLHFGARGNNAEGASDMRPDTSPLNALGFRCQISFPEGIRQLLRDFRADDNFSSSAIPQRRNPAHAGEEVPPEAR